MRILMYPFIILVGLWSTNSAAQSSSSIDTITIVYANKWAPVSMGDGSAVKGILPDLIEEIIHKRMGIKVKHNGLPWARAQIAVKNGTADGFVTTPTDARLQYSIRSDADVLNLPFQAFVAKNGPYMELLQQKSLDKVSGATFCDVLGNGWAKAFYNSQNIEYIEVPTIENCLNMMIKGRADIIIHASPVTQLFIKNLSLGNQISMLAHIYPESPTFPLLLSKKSNFGKGFLTSFNKIVLGMKNSGEFKKLLEQLTQKNISIF